MTCVSIPMLDFILLIVSSIILVLKHVHSYYKNPHSVLRILHPAFFCIPTQRTCSYQFSYILHTKRTLAKILPVSLLRFFKITHPYSIEVIGISSVLTSFPYMTRKQWQPADMVKHSDFSPFWLCVPAFQQVCL